MDTQQIRYCLYARKSSDSDEGQAISIDSQVKEMETLAKGIGIKVGAVKQESHSAKNSSERPVCAYFHI
jgi:DNA invertase Pin-like site-specific DNA recombinase